MAAEDAAQAAETPEQGLSASTQRGQLPDPSTYSQTAPPDVAELERYGLVEDWENAVRNSASFNDPIVTNRYEQGIWVYTSNDSSDVMIVNMPASTRDPVSGLYRSIPAGEPPSIDGYTVDLALHDHPFPLPGSGSSTYGYPQPSQADIEYAGHYNVSGIVVSHAGNYYFGRTNTGVYSIF